MWRDKTLSLTIEFARDIGVGSWHGRTLLIGNPRWCQFSILVVERGPVASVFCPRRQREPSIPLHEWECLEHLDGLRCELCLLLPARISGRVTPADETVFREPYRKAELMVYGQKKILEPVDSAVNIELLSIPVNTHEIDATPRALAPSMNCSSQLPDEEGSAAVAGLPRRMPVAIRWGQRSSACCTVMFAWSVRSGSLNPSRTEPLFFASSSCLGSTNVSPHIIGTNSTPSGLVIRIVCGCQV